MSCPTCGAHSIICGGCGKCLTHCTCGPMPGPGISMGIDRAGPEPSRSVVFVCGGRRGRRQNCRFCSRYASKLCDFELTGAKAGKTCDEPICDRCAYKVGPGKDFCPPHYRLREKQAEEMRARIAAAENTVEPI